MGKGEQERQTTVDNGVQGNSALHAALGQRVKVVLNTWSSGVGGGPAEGSRGGFWGRLCGTTIYSGEATTEVPDETRGRERL